MRWLKLFLFRISLLLKESLLSGLGPIQGNQSRGNASPCIKRQMPVLSCLWNYAWIYLNVVSSKPDFQLFFWYQVSTLSPTYLIQLYSVYLPLASSLVAVETHCFLTASIFCCRALWTLSQGKQTSQCPPSVSSLDHVSAQSLIVIVSGIHSSATAAFCVGGEFATSIDTSQFVRHHAHDQSA